MLVVAVAAGCVLAATSLLSQTAARICRSRSSRQRPFRGRAFVDGHPFRIRYMVPLMAVQAICAGSWPRAGRRPHPHSSRSLLVVAVYDLRPLDPGRADGRRSTMGSAERRAAPGVTACLRMRYSGENVMASMGSLGHYMQEPLACRLLDPRFPARGQRRHLARRAQRAAPVRRMDSDRGEGRRRRHAGCIGARASRIPRRLLARLRRAGLALYRRADYTDPDRFRRNIITDVNTVPSIPRAACAGFRIDCAEMTGVAS